MSKLDNANQFDTLPAIMIGRPAARSGEAKIRTLSPAVAAMAAQLAYFLVRMLAAHNPAYGNAIAGAGIALAALGIAAGIHTFRAGAREQGICCSGVSIAMVIFWNIAHRVATDPLFV